MGALEGGGKAVVCIAPGQDVSQSVDFLLSPDLPSIPQEIIWGYNIIEF